MPCTYKSNQHIWASLRGLAGYCAAKNHWQYELFSNGNNVKVEIFMFNKTIITFCQPSEVVSKVKMLFLHCLYPYRKPRWAEVGHTIHMVKGVFVRFGFDAIRISQIQRQVKNKATKNVSWGVLYTALIGFGRFCRSSSECILYTYTGVGLSALLVSTCRAMREPL